MASKNGKVATAPAPTDLADKVTNVVLGAPVAVAEVVNQTFDRLKDSGQRDKDIKAVRDQIDKGLTVAEKKGVTVRKQFSGRIEPAKSRVQPAVDRIQPTVDRIQPTVQKLQTEARTRSSKVTNTTTEQFRKAQERVRGLA